MSKRREKNQEPLVIIVDPEYFVKSEYWQLRDAGFRVEQRETTDTSWLIRERPSIIYFNREKELGYEPGSDGRNLAATLRRTDPTLKIGLLDLTDSFDPEELQQFFDACKQYDGKILRYLKDNDGSHAIQGRPSVQTLGRVISATLNGEPINTSYDHTRVVLPE